MFKKIEIPKTDSLTLKHLVIANFGYLLANTINKDVVDKIDLNMQYLTAYLIESNLISSLELKEIVNEQTNFKLTNGYTVINMFKGDELIRPYVLFQLSNLTSNLNKLFFKDTRTSKLFKIKNLFKKNSHIKIIEDIYTSFFNIHKEKNIHSENYSSKIIQIQNLICSTIDTIDTTNEKELIFYIDDENNTPVQETITYVDEKDEIIKNLQNEKVNILEHLSKYILIANERFEKDDISGVKDVINYNLLNMTLSNLRTLNIPMINQKYPSLNIYYDALKRNLDAYNNKK